MRGLGSEESKMLAYKQIMRARRDAFLCFVGFLPLGGLFIEGDYIFYFIIPWFIVMVVLSVRLHLHGMCPWCHNLFFTKGNVSPHGFEYLRKHCANCNEPKNHIEGSSQNSG